ncbi:hypothetical protein tinsulaeT_32500 [Thalassotalea insulae]|uniref:Thioredoxin domain-containing protein n=1 Tax=Thalassotalea insulae TaxID=2056778 RepID=A0ABQ6GYU6_9GAMM|nr:redoxin domain-containing protein [Thalassotalea insulae]GLX79910.1 hypothetical protein tinsulaeT_32500 [Thalassotalea insulae]
MLKFYRQSLLALFALFTSFNVFSSNLPDELLHQPITLLSGKQVTLADFQGNKPVYLKFWATWCQPCLKEMPHFQHIQQQYGDSIEVISINLGLNDDAETVAQTVKKFNLTMPMTIDKSGDLAKAFHFIGTPYHLLFDKQMNLVHLGHKANESLDNKIALLSQQENVDLLASNKLQENEADLKLNLNDGKTHALLFTATWCDWYLKDSRPEVSQSCITAQQNANVLYQQYPQIAWQGVISRLWTGEKDVSAYKKKYTIEHPIALDKTNQLFHQYAVNDLPTLILIKDNKVLLRTNDLKDQEQLHMQLAVYAK